ncbi:MAG TPA: glycosyltransferase family 4 protein [Polyangiaceae bacterium]|nr:glycosyltransferase family 4 protein [Polyangiaceae bacterium]
MRVAVVTTSWPDGAGDPSGHFVRAEARALEQDGHEVVVIAPPAGAGGAFGWPGVAARIRERPARALDAARWVLGARRRLGELGARCRPGELGARCWLGELGKLGTERRIERVIAHWAVPCAWPVAAGAAVPLEVVSHGGDVRLLARLPQPARGVVVRAIASRAHAWRFVSEPLMTELLVALDRASRRRVEAIAVVRPALLEMPDVRDAVALRRRALGGLRVAVSVGRLVATKRVDRVIEHVARSGDVDALVVVGDGPERARLQRLARRRGVDARFVGTVARDDALAWIGAAALLVHASEAEGLSTVVREAQALGTPVRVV